MDLALQISKFFSEVEESRIEIYNEFSLQHELGIWLRGNVPPPFKIQFERNVRFFDRNAKCVKSEIDIVIYGPDDERKYAIELKFPDNGQHPEAMFSFIKDIMFMEQVKKIGFDKTYAVTYVQDRLFYDGPKTDGIYAYFRNHAIIHGEIRKPTGKKDETCVIEGHYRIDWKTLANGAKYYIVTL
jgi:hypothetical protein